MTPLHLLEVGLTWPLDTYLADKFEQLAARGVRVTVALVTTPGGAQTPQLNNVEILRQPHWGEAAPRIIGRATRDALGLALRSPTSLTGAIRAARTSPARHGRLAGIRRVRSYLPMAELRPDVVHFEWNSAAIRFQPLAAVWGCPTVMSCHGSEVNVRAQAPGQEAFAHDLRAALGAADAVHCVSAAVAENARRLGMDPAKEWLIPSGVDTHVFTPLRHRRPEPAAPLRVVSVGSLRRLKDHVTAVAAIRDLAERGVSATLDIIGGDPSPGVGEASERARIEDAIRVDRIQDRVRLNGAASHVEVKRALQEADVLLHTSLSEGSCVVVLEAMACGLPVVVSDYSGIHEVVTHGVDGLIFARGQASAAASALQQLDGDPPLRTRLGQMARRRVEQQFTVERQIDRFIQLYETVAGRSSSHTAARRSVPPPSSLACTGSAQRDGATASPA